jgi:hypothetical protein
MDKLKRKLRRWRRVRDPMTGLIAGLVVGDVLLLGILYLVMMR